MGRLMPKSIAPVGETTYAARPGGRNSQLGQSSNSFGAASAHSLAEAQSVASSAGWRSVAARVSSWCTGVPYSVDSEAMARGTCCAALAAEGLACSSVSLPSSPWASATPGPKGGASVCPDTRIPLPATPRTTFGPRNPNPALRYQYLPLCLTDSGYQTGMILLMGRGLFEDAPDNRWASCEFRVASNQPGAPI